MSEEQAPPTSAAPTAAANPARGGRVASWSAGLAVILAGMALVVGIYLWYVLVRQEGLADANVAARLDALETQAKATQQALAQTGDKLDALRQEQDTLKRALARVSSNFGQRRAEFTLGEAEQLLLIANQRLQLAHDVDLALVALRAADNRLRELSNPNLLPVRRLVANEMRELESINHVDVDGISLKLGSIASHVGALPLAVDTRFKTEQAANAPKTAEGNGVSRFLGEMWRDMKSLIRVRRDVNPAKPLLAPNQEYFLRQNLRLMLYGAQLAALQREQTTYTQNIAAARDWLKTYFDVRDAAVASAISDLGQLQRVRVRQALPDISASLALLQKIRRQGAS